MTPLNPVRRALALAVMTGFAWSAQAQNTFKIGEINSYKAQPAFLEPYKKGMELAIDEVNAAGGVSGKKFELITRDDNANPGDAVRAAEELISREKIDVLTGTFLSNTGLAVADFAKQKRCSFWPVSPCRTNSLGKVAMPTPSVCVPAPTCKRPCWCLKLSS